MDDVVVLLLAAGASSRMRGADKLLQPVDGISVLRRSARAALDTGARVLVALPTDRPQREAAITDLPVQQVAVHNAAEGMGASIRAGVAAAPAGIKGLAILPSDMPELTANDLTTVLSAFRRTPGHVLRGASGDGRPGHPVVFPARLFGALATLSGDTGARSVLQGEEVRLHPLPDQHALTDLDTPEDWAAWHARRSTPESK